MSNPYIIALLQGESTSSIRVFTTQADTLFGVSFLALSPEHELLQRRELFSDATLRAVDEMNKSSSLPNSTSNDANRAKHGIHLI